MSYSSSINWPNIATEILRKFLTRQIGENQRQSFYQNSRIFASHHWYFHLLRDCWTRSEILFSLNRIYVSIYVGKRGNLNSGLFVRIGTYFSRSNSWKVLVNSRLIPKFSFPRTQCVRLFCVRRIFITSLVFHYYSKAKTLYILILFVLSTNLRSFFVKMRNEFLQNRK